MSPQARMGLIAGGLVGFLGMCVACLIGAYWYTHRDKPTARDQPVAEAPATPIARIERPADSSPRRVPPKQAPALPGAQGPSRWNLEPPPVGVTPQPPKRRNPAAPGREPPKRPEARIFASAADLLADMPKAAYPDGDSIEWAACQKWCEANLTGRRVAWAAKVTAFEVSGDGPFEVTLGTDVPMIEGGVVLGNPVPLGKTKWGVVLSGFEMMSRDRNRIFDFDGRDLTVTYERCTADEAKALRALKGREVTFEATIGTPGAWGNAVKVDGTKRARVPIPGSPFEEKELDWLPLRCHISSLSVNGFLPAANRPIPPAEEAPNTEEEDRPSAKPDRPAEEDAHANGISPKKSDYYVDDKITVRGKVQFLIPGGDYYFESDREKQKKMKVKPGLVIHVGGYELFCFMPQTTGAEFERLSDRLTGRRVRVTGKVTSSMDRELWLSDCEATLIK